MLSHFIREEEGQTLVEYALLISFIAMTVIFIVTIFWKKIDQPLQCAGNQLTKD